MKDLINSLFKNKIPAFMVQLHIIYIMIYNHVPDYCYPPYSRRDETHTNRIIKTVYASCIIIRLINLLLNCNLFDKEATDLIKRWFK